MRDVTVGWAEGKFAQDVEVGGHRFRADEEKDKGGDDTGPAPHELLLAALGSCTAMTLKVYAERKGWPLRDVRVTLSGATGDPSTSAGSPRATSRGDSGFVITRHIQIDGDVDAEQRQRLIEIADKCPVHKTLSGAIHIQTVAV